MTERRSQLVAAAAILAMAIVLTLPAMLGPERLNDSYWIDWVWLDQFSRELGQGVLYPRWLTQSHDGLGSPVFYYYPPLAFYAASIFRLAGLGVFPALLATFFTGYLLSGAGVYLWLKDQTRTPLVGALFYMFAPYHTFNFYLRGALAEFLAAAILPFVMIGLKRAGEQRRGGYAIASVSYAAMIASHLPLALLASVFLFAPYSLLLIRKRRAAATVLAGSFATGIALASIYLLPALMLEPYRDAAKLWAHAYVQAKNWSFWNHSALAPPGYPASLITGCTIAIPLLGMCIWRRSGWALFGLGSVILAVGTIPALWALPLLKSVQFPFRLLPVAEFALATSIALAPFRLIPIMLAAVPLLAGSWFISTVPGPKPSLTIQQIHTLRPDVPENLPPGERPYTWPSHWALSIAQTHRQPTITNGITTEPVFYFPAWEVRCGQQVVPSFPASQTQLLAYRGVNCTRSLRWTFSEYLGAFLSILGLIALLGATAFRRLRKKPA
jgi:uncharacterized membrane protein